MTFGMTAAARLLVIASWHFAAGYPSAAVWWIDQAVEELGVAGGAAA